MTAVAVRPRSLVVLAGLPGAGKSTLLAAADTDGAPAVVLDSDQVRTALRGFFPEALPYRLYRPLVHLVHRLRIVWFAITANGLLLVHEPSTRPTTAPASSPSARSPTGRGTSCGWTRAPRRRCPARSSGAG